MDKRQDADNVCEVNGYVTVETVMWRNVRGESVQRVHSLRRTQKLRGGGDGVYACVCSGQCRSLSSDKAGALSHSIMASKIYSIDVALGKNHAIKAYNSLTDV